MSAQPVNPNTPPDHVNIEIDGQAMTAPKGSMIIQAADKAGIAIPRFCYHDKLPIAANCRMCLVEVEKSPKPMPACATPVMEGMKVQTRSTKALASQRNVMEFLLINHPLDCPICDQGGECELQDVSMGYGRSVSRFVEGKRSVADEDLGPLIATEMTRCIQCTRCVRFVSEVAGTYELGGMSRGENLEIGTYIGKTIESEIGGNIIDVCPVGALTNKPFRFQARAWELIARESVAYHDALGSNLWLHTRRGEVLRTVPRDNEAINECWLSDRDRYSHTGLYAADRVTRPLRKKRGQWNEVGWHEALAFVVEKLKAHAGDDLGVLVHPATTSEEGALLARLARGLGSKHIDHRLRQLDFADGAAGHGFDTPVADIEKANAILLVGCNLRFELPLVNQRVRKAWKRGAKVHALNPLDFNFNYELTSKQVLAPDALVEAVLKLARAVRDSGHVPEAAELDAAIGSVGADEAAKALAKSLGEAASSVLILGESAVTHPQASLLRAAARFVAQHTQSGYNEIPQGANAVGLARAGVLPAEAGLDARTMLALPRKAYLLYGVEPPFDVADGASAMKALSAAEVVIAFSRYASEHLKALAEVILPIGALPEIDGTVVNLNGIVQTVTAGAKLPGEARPGWKALRALGEKLGLAGFDFVDLAPVRADLAALGAVPRRAHKLASRAAARGIARIATTPIYRGDDVLRRCEPLQSHPLTSGAALGLNAEDALALGLGQGAMAKVSGPAGTATLPVHVSRAVPRGAAWIESAYIETSALPPYGADLAISKA